MDVALLDVLTIVEHGIALGYDVDVLQADTIDGHLGQTVELHSTSGTITDDVLDIDVAEDGGLLSNGLLGDIVRIVAIGQHLSHRLAPIIHIKGNGIGLDISHRDVVDEDVLDNAATATCRLEAQTDIGAQELTVLHKDVSNTATHL